MSAPKRRETDGKEHQFPRPFCPSMPALLHLSLLSALRSPPVPSAVRRAPAPLLCDGDGEWSSREDWALTDLAASFTVGEGEHKATFWEALASSTFELHGRSHSECAARMEELSPGKYGSQPRRLDVWQRLPDGRYMGVEDGRKVKVSVSEEGRLTKGSRPMYIELTCGRIYELVAGGDLSADVSVPPPVSELAPVREPAKTRPSGQLVAIAALALVALGESFALANSFGLDWGQMLILDRVSAADVHPNPFKHAPSSQRSLRRTPPAVQVAVVWLTWVPIPRLAGASRDHGRDERSHAPVCH